MVGFKAVFGLSVTKCVCVCVRVCVCMCVCVYFILCNNFFVFLLPVNHLSLV